MPSHHRRGSHSRRQAHDRRHDRDPGTGSASKPDFSGSLSRSAWHKSIELADHCKRVVYEDTQYEKHPFNKMLPLHGSLLSTLTDVQNRENGGDVMDNKPFTPRLFRHQIIRKFMHIHKPLLGKICRHYMTNSFGHKQSHQTVSLKLIRDVVQQELEQNRMIGNAGDCKILEMIVAQDQVISAIHELLKHLKTNVCAIRWCSEWCNELDMWTDAHAPLLALITPNAQGILPSYLTESNFLFRPRLYFGTEMGAAITELHPKDLLRLIQIQWESDVMKHNTLLVPHAPTGRLRYNGNVATLEFMQKRAWWIGTSKRVNYQYQQTYKHTHPTLEYDRVSGAYN